MTSPYLEKPLRSLEEARRGGQPRNWGVPLQTTHVRCTTEELEAVAKAAEKHWNLFPEAKPLPLFDRLFILAIAGALGLSAGLLFLLTLAR